MCWGDDAGGGLSLLEGRRIVPARQGGAPTREMTESRVASDVTTGRVELRAEGAQERMSWDEDER
jgi:hypothetical protein